MTKFQAGITLTCLTRGGQMHAIGKAIRPLFADPVTYASRAIGRLKHRELC